MLVRPGSRLWPLSKAQGRINRGRPECPTLRAWSIYRFWLRTWAKMAHCVNHCIKRPKIRGRTNDKSQWQRSHKNRVGYDIAAQWYELEVGRWWREGRIRELRWQGRRGENVLVMLRYLESKRTIYSTHPPTKSLEIHISCGFRVGQATDITTFRI